MDTPHFCGTTEDTLESRVLKVMRDYSCHLAVWLRSCCSPKQATGTYGDKSASYLPSTQRDSSHCALHLHDRNVHSYFLVETINPNDYLIFKAETQFNS